MKQAFDIAKIAQQHPRPLASILAKSTGALGEVLVADKLLSLGYRAEPRNNNDRQRDLITRSPRGVEFGVEVKADRQRRPTWFVRTRPDADASAIWILVSAPREPAALPDPSAVEMFVLTVEEVRGLWDSSDWNRRNPANGDIRRWQVPDDARDAWHKLPR